MPSSAAASPIVVYRSADARQADLTNAAAIADVVHAVGLSTPPLPPLPPMPPPPMPQLPLSANVGPLTPIPPPLPSSSDVLLPLAVRA
jgi:hypothetical protein